MQWIVKISLVLHVVAGVTALFVAPVAMALKKGGQGHRNWGLTFFWAMTVIFITALFLSTVQWSPFLLMIAVFSYYSVFSGYRWKFLKNLHRGQSVKWYDWGALVLNVTFNLSFITWGFFLAVKSDALGVAFLAMGFGLFGVFLSVDNLLLFLKPHAPPGLAVPAPGRNGGRVYCYRNGLFQPIYEFYSRMAAMELAFCHWYTVDLLLERQLPQEIQVLQNRCEPVAWDIFSFVVNI